MRRLANLLVVLGATLTLLGVGPLARPRFGLTPSWQFAIGLAVLLIGLGAAIAHRGRDR